MEKPWGKYEVLLDEPEYKVKKITLNPNQQFSLQYHNNRSEDWVIVEGSGTVATAPPLKVGIIKPCAVGDRFHIPKKHMHRATAGDDGLVFIEVQIGKCEEEDIVRLEDDYGRIEKETKRKPFEPIELGEQRKITV